MITVANRENAKYKLRVAISRAERTPTESNRQAVLILQAEYRNARARW
jgi:hypothetical protein